MRKLLQNPKSTAARVLAAVLSLLVWQLLSLALGNPLLLPGPWEVLLCLGTLLGTAPFWAAVTGSFLRITAGFLLALAAGLLLAVPAGLCPWVETLLRPYMKAIRSVPVASFIILALLLFSSRYLSIFISFLMVLPILYSNILQGVRSADGKLLEMASLFHMSRPRRLRYIYLPAAEPYLLAGCGSALGLCWKAGVAAEVIGVVSGSVGGALYDCKVYLETAELLAWTLVIIAVSGLFERLFLRLLRGLLRRLEGV